MPLVAFRLREFLFGRCGALHDFPRDERVNSGEYLRADLSNQANPSIVPYPAGGGTDFFARLVGQKMSELHRPADRGREQAGRGDHVARELSSISED